MKNSGSFKKGVSGNPGGRPKVLGDVQALARQHTNEAIKTLAAIMRDTKAPPAARALASTSILDRAYGRPAQAITMERKNIDAMSDAELLVIAASDTEEGPSSDDEPVTNSRKH